MTRFLVIFTMMFAACCPEATCTEDAPCEVCETCDDCPPCEWPDPDPCLAAAGTFTLVVELPDEPDACMHHDMTPESLDVTIDPDSWGGECRPVVDSYYAPNYAYILYWAGEHGPEYAQLVITNGSVDTDCVYTMHVEE